MIRHVAHMDECTEDECIAFGTDFAQIRYAGDVDEQIRLLHLQFHQIDERRAAGEQARLTRGGGQRMDCLLGSRGGQMAKWLHGGGPYSAAC